MVDYIPKRGDIVWINCAPQAGREQKGIRPALVVSYTKFNQKTGFVMLCPISNTKRKNSFYVAIPEGLVVTGVIMTDQLRSLDYSARAVEFICICPEELLKEVLRRIKPIMF
jgi:mRNA interferase MazF